MSAWCVRVRYITQIAPGVLDVTYDVDDLSDVELLIKQGPERSCILIDIRPTPDPLFPIVPIEGGEAISVDLVRKLEKLDLE